MTAHNIRREDPTNTIGSAAPTPKSFDCKTFTDAPDKNKPSATPTLHPLFGTRWRMLHTKHQGTVVVSSESRTSPMPSLRNDIEFILMERKPGD